MARDLPSGPRARPEGHRHEVAGRRHPALRARQGARPDDAQAAARGRLPVVRRAEQADDPSSRVRERRRFPLDNQVAVVTGACGKLGAVWTEALLEAGARVAALDLPAAAVPTARFEELTTRAGDAVQCFDCDITSRESIEAAARSRRRAAWASRRCSSTTPASTSRPTARAAVIICTSCRSTTFRRMVEVNLLGTFQVTQVFGARMAAHGGGSIINIGSLYASVSPDPHFYDAPGRQRAVHQVARLRRVEGRRSSTCRSSSPRTGPAAACA